MTPDAVIYRYLQIISAEDVDADSLCRLLFADADLLARWLKLLDVPADSTRLREGISALTQEEFDGLAQAQAWTVLPIVGAARLSTQQWLSVLNAAMLAEVLVEHFYQPEDEYVEAVGLDSRLRILLAISGVQLEQDSQLNALSEFRGAQPQLLEDAELELRIFAVVDGVEFGREAQLAEDLLQLSGSKFQDLQSIAQGRTRQLIETLGIDTDEDVDWAHRIWLRQQIVVVTTALAQARNWRELSQLHSLVSRALFVRPPLLLRYDEDSRRIVRQHHHSAADDGVRINIDSQASVIAGSLRELRSATVFDSSDTAVVDRQLLKALQSEQALVVPLAARQGLLLVADDEEIDAAGAAQIYAEEFSKYLSAVQDNNGTAAEPVDDAAATMLAQFREHEQQRLREVVHEANNPLSIVHNYLHILELRLQHEPEAVEQLTLIASELRRAGDVFAQAREVPDAAMLLAGSDEGDADVDSVEVVELELGAWLKDLVEIHSGYAMQNGVDLSSTLPHQDLLVVLDRNRLSQIIGNLVKNAIEACAIGGDVDVGCRDGVVRAGRPGYELFVRDTGPGLDTDTLANIAAVKESQKGDDHQGVGLHLAYRLTAELGAALDVHTQPEQGTTFTLFLPREIEPELNQA